jgi:hypothetical protein
MVHGRYVARVVLPSQGVWKSPSGVVISLHMTDPLSLSAGIGARLIASAALLAVLWAGVAWALAA